MNLRFCGDLCFKDVSRYASPNPNEHHSTLQNPKKPLDVRRGLRPMGMAAAKSEGHCEFGCCKSPLQGQRVLGYGRIDPEKAQLNADAAVRPPVPFLLQTHGHRHPAIAGYSKCTK